MIQDVFCNSTLHFHLHLWSEVYIDSSWACMSIIYLGCFFSRVKTVQHTSLIGIFLWKVQGIH